MTEDELALRDRLHRWRRLKWKFAAFVLLVVAAALIVWKTITGFGDTFGALFVCAAIPVAPVLIFLAARSFAKSLRQS